MTDRPPKPDPRPLGSATLARVVSGTLCRLVEHEWVDPDPYATGDDVTEVCSRCGVCVRVTERWHVPDDVAEELEEQL
jgi:hypothetical protein